MWDFSCDYMFRDEREGILTGQPMRPRMDTETIRTVLSTNRVDSTSFSSRCWAFRRTHTNTDPCLSTANTFIPCGLLVAISFFCTRLFPDPRFLLFVLQNIAGYKNATPKMRLNVCFNEMALYGPFAALIKGCSIYGRNGGQPTRGDD